MHYFYICIEQMQHDMITNNHRNAQATVKFVDCDFVNGTTTLMSGLNLITISANDYRILQKFSNEWDSGLERVSPHHKATVWKFSAKNAHGAEGLVKAGLIAEILKIGGQLV